MTLVGASMMCADYRRLEHDLCLLDDANIDYFHFDIMDGQFVPNITLGPDLITALRPLTKKTFDVHLMITEPERFIEQFVNTGANMITVHVESTIHLERTLQLIKKHNVKAGVALNPATPLNVLDYVYDVIDHVCIMTVNPGFAGQPFVASTLNKITQLKNIIDEKNLNINIQVDGNISHVNIPKVTQAGANMLVCGTSSLFMPNIEYKEAIQTIHQLIQK